MIYFLAKEGHFYKKYCENGKPLYQYAISLYFFVLIIDEKCWCSTIQSISALTGHTLTSNC